MSTDRTTKVLLALVAVALWVSILSQMGPSSVAADPSVAPEEGGALARQQAGAVQSLQAPGEEYLATSQDAAPRAVTLPLRWRVTLAAHLHTDTAGSDECFTALVFQTVGSTSVAVEVEFFDNFGSSLGMTSTTVAPGDTTNLRTDSGGSVAPAPFTTNAFVSTGNFSGGFAHVHADDPRIILGAFYRCREDGMGGGMRSFSVIPSIPVGATADFFRAGMPATSAPYVTVPNMAPTTR
jgi:hypothetical protein